MDALEQVILSNAVMATVLALLASTVGLVCRRPALVHSLWLLVLIKLITPPIWQIEVFQVSSPSQEQSVSTPLSISKLPRRRSLILVNPNVRIKRDWWTMASWPSLQKNCL